MKVLILGGTTEASAFARMIAGDSRFEATLSLAGVTNKPASHPIDMRIGGFSEEGGLAMFLMDRKIDVLVDATHPFATNISMAAKIAADSCGVHLINIVRSEWTAGVGDRWTMVPTLADAIRGLGFNPRRVFMPVGKKEVEISKLAPQHIYIIRTIDPVPLARLPPLNVTITARGPFDAESELNLMVSNRVDIIIAKNSGAAATQAKIVAARTLGLPVIMVQRPPKPHGDACFHSAQEAHEALLIHAKSILRNRGV
ncbi:cobalt-precorrin-6A reductase [Rhodoligotrophos appendicifer]|uniref:cobalt-precorrin-6A reductase n=1 Tax=Rhodoligotrophos appendicifer TaxID=987056 RepID=UPI001FE891DA|nr:cobalt-precorrin-6A reductase [Rhodoligotrophos appendicifer]